MSQFDVCVIGAGPAGFAAAMRAYDFGANVCLVERSKPGGAGIYHGVLMSKTLWELSCDYRDALRTDRGYTATDVSVNFDSVRATLRRAMAEKVSQLQTQINKLSKPIAPGVGRVTYLNGEASFQDTQTLLVKDSVDNVEHLIAAKNFIIATGSRPRSLDFAPTDGHRIINSDHNDSLDCFPESIVIVGAGVVGCEFATVLSNFGKTKVFIIDRAERILPFEDSDIAEVCAANFQKKGVTIHSGATLKSLEAKGDGVQYIIECGGATQTIDVKCALISVGRIPNTDKLNLEKAQVNCDKAGYIINESTVTSNPNIYAVGDVTSDQALVNVGEIEGRHAVERIYGAQVEPISYKNLSTIMFLDPEVAAVGLNETQAQKEKIPYRVARYDYSLVNRAIAMRDTEGFVKVIASDEDNPKLLGMRALGAHASSSIEAMSLAIQEGIRAKEFGNLVHPHPAITEAVQDCVRMFTGSSIYKPEVFPSALRLSRVTF